jgi:hypothetical protein
LCYHKCCIDGGTSPEYYGYHLVLLADFNYSKFQIFYYFKQALISLTDFTKILPRRISLKQGQREPKFCLLVGADKGGCDEVNRRFAQPCEKRFEMKHTEVLIVEA